MVLRKDKQQVPYHSLDLACFSTIALRHSVHNYRIRPERCNVESESGKQCRMFLKQAHVLHTHLHRHREKCGLGGRFILRQGLKETVIHYPLHRTTDMDHHKSGARRSQDIFTLKHKKGF